jgi:hypothetical protein
MRAVWWCSVMSIEVGSRFGRLLVQAFLSGGRVSCRCDCGREKVVRRDNLLRNTRSCGCLKGDLLKRKWKEVSIQTALPQGAIFGRLRVVGSDRQQTLCDCACGQEVWVRKYDLLSGKTSSCGCLAREVSAKNLREMSTRHGGWGSSELNLWHNMVRRCFDPNAMGYENYGGRGITVCDSWVGPEGFQRFLQDMGPRPTSRHTLDRLSNDQDYAPWNVRWATPKQQARNRRNNHLVTAFGRTQCLAAWAEEVSLSSTTIRYRLLKGWSPERALTRKSK